MPYPISNISLKIQRADQHINECRGVLQDFISTHPYKIVRQANLKSGKIVFVVEKADPVPVQISIIVGDALQNLRTTLDYLAHALVIANNRRPTKDTSFPILKGDIGSEVYKPTFDGKVKGMRCEAIEKIKGLKPYKGGNDILYRLHALNNIDKHRLLIAAGSAASRFTPEPIEQKVIFDPEQLEQALTNRFVRIPGIFPLYEGQEVMIDPPPAESGENVTLFAEVAINEPKITEPVPLIVLLRQSRRSVWKICLEFAQFLRQ